MDSENEGIMLASCAGGCSTLVKLPVSEAEVTGTKVSVALTGLTGGHSGVEIDKGRGNANVLMSRIIRDVAKVAPVSIVSMEGGKKDNAIPRDCTAEFVVAADKAEAVCQAVTKEVAEIKNELSTSDPEIKLAVETTENFAGKAVTEEDSKKAVALIQALPNGIMRMSQDIENLVETSLNLGILALENGELNLRYALRSSVGSAVESLRNQLECIAEAFGGIIEVSGAYPAWEYKKDSKLRDDMVRIFAEMYGKEPTVEAIHAGVECGLLSGKIPGLDCISMGPDMYDIHTSEERLSISSTKRMYEYVVNVIQCK